MAKKVKEKPTKNANIDLDNEIIIGIKTLPEIEPKKKSKKKKTAKKNNTTKKTKTTAKSKKDEFELKLGIEDKKIKTKEKTPKKLTKKQKMATKKRKTVIRLDKVDKSNFDFNRWRNIFFIISIFQYKKYRNNWKPKTY